ncbi:hypothetical protein B9C99_24035 [Rhodococcus sp. BUPNP1]|nr:hypothetical protein B9C99_24035 [Rhodococcus sp. BUPNP1]
MQDHLDHVGIGGAVRSSSTALLEKGLPLSCISAETVGELGKQGASEFPPIEHAIGQFLACLLEITQPLGIRALSPLKGRLQ